MRVMAMPIMLHSQEGEGEEEEATEAVAGAVEVGAVGLVLVTHRVVEEDGVRSAFSDKKGAYRQTASQVDGAGHMHAGGSRFVIAGATVSGQEKGFQEWKDTSQSDGFLCFVHNMMFDESSFELRPAGRGALESHSILGSHAQSTGITRNQEVLDEHLILVPKSLCPTNSSTMWRALSAGSGGYYEALSGLQSGFVAVLTTCDAHRANIKLLKFIGQKLPGPALMLPTLCVQHRTGNVIEQVTKFLGNLGGIFCVSKVMAKSHLLAVVKSRLDYLDQKLVVHQEVPAAVLSERRASKILLKRLIELTSSFKEEEEANQNSTSAAWMRFMEFFNGLIIGLTVFWGLFVALACLFHLPHLKCTLRPRAGFEELHDSPVLLLINLKPRCFWQVLEFFHCSHEYEI